VRHVKPKASRAESAEMYVLATGFRGAADRPQNVVSCPSRESPPLSFPRKRESSNR
jgi:23S rRNA (uridine2552-2'-O)-methyltransferase